MKLKTTKNLTVEVSSEEIASLLTRLVEKKTGKKVTGINAGEAPSYIFELAEEVEETNLDEPKA